MLHPDPIAGSLIWKLPLPLNPGHEPVEGKIRLEFPHLARFNGAWYCGFREAQIHGTHRSGIGRIIRSVDGKTWESVKEFRWRDGDVREPRLTVTADGYLMANAIIYHLKQKPRAPHDHRLIAEPNKLGGVPHTHDEAQVCVQSVTWFSEDGVHWSSAYACPSGANTRRYDVTWHHGMAYSASCAVGRDLSGTIYRSRDGRSWRTLATNVVPVVGQGDEMSLAFGEDDLCCALMRGDGRKKMWIGHSAGPGYQQWSWKVPTFDWKGDGSTDTLASDLLRVELGGPYVIRLSDGRFIGAGRALGPVRPEGKWRVDPGDPKGGEDGRITLFWIDPLKFHCTRFAELDGTSYMGMVEHEGELWCTCWGGTNDGIHLMRIPIPRK